LVDEMRRTKLRHIKTVSMIGLLTTGHAYAQTVNTTNMQNYFNDVCDRVIASPGTGSILSARKSVLAASRQGQSDLFNSCVGYFQSEGGLSDGFFSALSAEGFEALKLDALLFAQTESDNAMDRLQTLRRARVANTQTALQFDAQPRNGSAGADDEGGLLNDAWGVWAHVNSTRGDKDSTTLTGSFGSTQRSFALGSDYRFGADTVLGASIGRRDTNALFGPGGAQGGMDSKTWTFSAYGSSFIYANWYLDAIVSYAVIDYDTRRTMIDSGFVAAHTAMGSTDGRTFSVGHSLGYDFNRGPLTVTPSLGYLYIDSKTNAFEEQGGDGLDLAFNKQHVRSTTVHFDVNAAYALNSSIGVWQPYIRAQWVREFSDGIDMLDVRFVNDVDPAAAPFKLRFDELDRQYCRVNVGVSAQFKHDLATYVDYRQLVGFQAVTLRTVTFGARLQF